MSAALAARVFRQAQPCGIRARTRISAIECLKFGVTTVQDMNSLVPQEEETLDAILAASAEIGIRVVFSIALRDAAALDIAPFLPADMPDAACALVPALLGEIADLARRYAAASDHPRVGDAGAACQGAQPVCGAWRVDGALYGLTRAARCRHRAGA